MTRPYRFLEHTGEVGAQAWGTDLAAVFGAAAQALFAVMADLRSVRLRRWGRGGGAVAQCGELLGSG